METGGQTVVQHLQRELEFLDFGGYEHHPWLPWPAPRIFQDSPSCPRVCDAAWPHSCRECWLARFVAPGLLQEVQTPCRWIDLTGNGMTVEFLHFWGTPEDTEEALRRWLRQRIREATVNNLGTLGSSSQSPLSERGLAIARQSFTFELGMSAARERWRAPEFLRSVDRVHRHLLRQANQAKILEAMLLENGEVEPGRRIDPFVAWSSVASWDRLAS